MNLNAAGLALIKKFEGIRLVVYKDLVGFNTVGYGHRTELAVGTKIDQKTADELLAGDLAKFCIGLKSCLGTHLNDNQFSALVSLAYNIGLGHFKTSTLLKLLNMGDLHLASREFIKWDRAGGMEVPGLLRRRLAEQELFNS